MELDPPHSIFEEPDRRPDPLDMDLSGSSVLPTRLLTCSLPPETVTMSLDDVLQYAQPVGEYTF